MHKLLQKNKKYLLFTLAIVIIGVIFGIIYYILLNSDTKENISNTLINFNNFRYNAILKDLIVMSSLLITSIFIIGIPLSLFYIFYESLSIGFLVSIFYANFKISGFIYILFYILLNKVITFILIFIFVKKLINVSRFIIGSIIYKKEIVIKEKLINNFKNSIYIIIIVFVINILLYFITPYIFQKLAFLLK